MPSCFHSHVKSFYHQLYFDESYDFVLFDGKIWAHHLSFPIQWVVNIKGIFYYVIWLNFTFTPQTITHLIFSLET